MLCAPARRCCFPSLGLRAARRAQGARRVPFPLGLGACGKPFSKMFFVGPEDWFAMLSIRIGFRGNASKLWEAFGGALGERGFELDRTSVHRGGF